VQTLRLSGGLLMTNQYSTDALRSMLDILGGVSEYRGAVLDFLDYVDRTAAPQDEPGDERCANCDSPRSAHTCIYDVCQGFIENRGAE
jgi:hypothetical protein